MWVPLGPVKVTLLPSVAAETMVTRALVLMLRPFAPVTGAPGAEPVESPAPPYVPAIASLMVMVSLSPGLSRPRLVTFGPATTVVCRRVRCAQHHLSRVVMSTETTVATNCSVRATAVGRGRGGVWHALRAPTIPMPSASSNLEANVAERSILGFPVCSVGSINGSRCDAEASRGGSSGDAPTSHQIGHPPRPDWRASRQTYCALAPEQLAAER